MKIWSCHLNLFRSYFQIEPSPVPCPESILSALEEISLDRYLDLPPVGGLGLLLLRARYPAQADLRMSLLQLLLQTGRLLPHAMDLASQLLRKAVQVLVEEKAALPEKVSVGFDARQQRVQDFMLFLRLEHRDLK
jgi:hypothetical protein